MIMKVRKTKAMALEHCLREMNIPFSYFKKRYLDSTEYIYNTPIGTISLGHQKRSDEYYRWFNISSHPVYIPWIDEIQTKLKTRIDINTYHSAFATIDTSFLRDTFAPAPVHGTDDEWQFDNPEVEEFSMDTEELDKISLPTEYEKTEEKTKIQTINSLTESIEKWDGIIFGSETDFGQMNCSCCQSYLEFNTEPEEFNDRCNECPIYKYTGREMCAGTPYEKWLKHQHYKHQCNLKMLPSNIYKDGTCHICGKSRNNGNESYNSKTKSYEINTSESWDMYRDNSPLHIHGDCKVCKKLAKEERDFLYKVRNSICFEDSNHHVMPMLPLAAVVLTKKELEEVFDLSDNDNEQKEEESTALDYSFERDDKDD